MQAIFTTEKICEVTSVTIDDLINRAKATEVKRFRLCLHHSTDEKIHEMAISLVGLSYVRPHRHPLGKCESYHIIRGKMDVYFFKNDGILFKKIRMGDFSSGKCFFYRLNSNIYHMPISVTDTVVYHEVYEGPFNKDIDVEYASWAPPENDVKAVSEFLDNLKKDSLG